MRDPMNLVLAFLVSTAFTVSCSVDVKGEAAAPPTIPTSFSYEDQPLQGKLGGVLWTLGSGTAKTSFANAQKYTLDLYGEEVPEICQNGYAQLPTERIMLSVDKNVGEINLSFNNTVTFYDGETNYIATEGKIEILSIGETQITGRMNVYFDAKNSINGNFTVEICD